MKSLSFKKLIVRAIIIMACYALYLFTLDETDMPPLQNGDLVFQTSWTDQSIAIGLASASLYIHTGIISNNDGNLSVIEAALHVTETPLGTWVNRGILKRFSVYRYKGLSPQQGENIVATARSYIGTPYDFYFSSGSDAIYCSELDYLAFNNNDIPLGTPQKIGSLYINNRFVKSLIEERWHNYPACKEEGITFEECYDRIMNGELVTPQAIARDPHLEKIFSNYP